MGTSVSSRSVVLPQWSGRPSRRANPPSAGRDSGRVRALERWLVRRLLGAVGNPPIALVLWNGEAIGHPAPEARLIIHDRRTFWQLLSDVYLNFGDAFSEGRVEVEGDLLAFLEIVYRSEDAQPPRGLAATLAEWRRKPRANTLDGSRSNIHHHYDIGDDFYRLWLDREMVYTCPTFRRRTFAWKRRKPPRWSWSAVNSGSSRARRWSRRVAAGGHWRFTWRGITE